MTPLLSLLRELTAAQRDEFAALSGTTTPYLYQLAGCNRRACSVLLAKRISDASLVMRKQVGSSFVTMEQLATMCPLKSK